MPALKRPGAGDEEEEDDEELEIIEPEAQQKKERDEFDISDSDDGGLANKVGATSKALKKKPPPKKLTKMSDLFPKAPKPAAKDPGLKKTTGAITGKHKKSETQSESEKPAKKKTKYFDSDSDEDFKVSPRPKSKRGSLLIIFCSSFIYFLFQGGGGRSKQVRYDESETDD